MTLRTCTTCALRFPSTDEPHCLPCVARFAGLESPMSHALREAQRVITRLEREIVTVEPPEDTSD